MRGGGDEGLVIHRFHDHNVLLISKDKKCNAMFKAFVVKIGSYCLLVILLHFSFQYDISYS